MHEVGYYKCSLGDSSPWFERVGPVTTEPTHGHISDQFNVITTISPKRHARIKHYYIQSGIERMTCQSMM